MHIWESINDTQHLFDVECSVCGLRKKTNTDDSKIDDCFTTICKTVMEENQVGFTVKEMIGASYFNPRGLLKLKI
jgi:hypothetical protein